MLIDRKVGPLRAVPRISSRCVSPLLWVALASLFSARISDRDILFLPSYANITLLLSKYCIICNAIMSISLTAVGLIRMEEAISYMQ